MHQNNDLNGLVITYPHEFSADGKNHRVETMYKDGKRHGQTVVYRADGTKSVRDFKNGEIDGLYTTYYANGNKESETSYTKNKPNGLAFNYKEDGSIDTALFWENGKCHEELTKRLINEFRITQFKDSGNNMVEDQQNYLRQKAKKLEETKEQWDTMILVLRM